jgi:hypothetical protein
VHGVGGISWISRASQDRSKGGRALPSNSPGTQGSKGLSEGLDQERCGSNRTGSAPVFPSPFVFSFERSSNKSCRGTLLVLCYCTGQVRPGQTNLSSSPTCVKNVLSGARPSKVYMQMQVQKGIRTKSHSPPKASPKRRSSGTELPKFQITVQRDCDGAHCSAWSPTKVCRKNSFSMSNDHHIRQLAVFASTTQLCRAPLQSLRQGEDAPVGQNRRVIVSKAETGLILAPGSARVPRR